MAVLATLQRSVKAGQSVWRFCEEDGSYYADNNYGKHIDCKNVEDLRAFYKKMLTYGFAPDNGIVTAG